ncbi:MAG: GTP 3',8-cyclase MoaA [Alphaproteobacteria bacterium]|nr:GTP 3',8-cyclase MoaA [Alphaproteobacteria bacterium]
MALRDTFGRNFPYLRLSVTDVCNFRCQYCLPNGYQCASKPSFLSTEEIRRVVDAFAAMGVHKIRLTGGEPTVRKDFTEIARLVSSHPKIAKTAFTTNGYRLRDHAREWRDAGLSAINVSVDSLRADRFHRITGHDRFSEVLEGVEAALDAGFRDVKVNVVLLRGVNDDELPDYLDWARRTPISIRFIELMQTGENLEYFRTYHASADTIKAPLEKAGWTRATRCVDAGPAQVYTHPDYAGTIGLIAPYSKDFCAGCNRLRVTSTGDLRLCLFGEQGIALRHLLQEDEQQPLLRALIQDQLAYKCSSHFLALGNTGITPHLASVGG